MPPFRLYTGLNYSPTFPCYHHPVGAGLAPTRYYSPSSWTFLASCRAFPAGGNKKSGRPSRIAALWLPPPSVPPPPITGALRGGYCAGRERRGGRRG
jgi:hypothetical protein